MNTRLCLDLVLIALLSGAAGCDLATRRIPNRLLASSLVAAAALYLVSSAPLSLLSSGLAGFATGLLLFLPLYLLRGMAAGDVKLMATVGAFTGPAAAFQICLLTCCIGGVMGLLIVTFRGQLRATGVNLMALLKPRFMRGIGVPLVDQPMPGPSVGSMPYGVAIALAAFVLLWFRYR